MLRKTTLADQDSLLNLHQTLAARPGGIIRTLMEISQEYIAGTLHKSLENGLMLVYELDGSIVGSIHA